MRASKRGIRNQRIWEGGREREGRGGGRERERKQIACSLIVLTAVTTTQKGGITQTADNR
jgi:hypothetical protein